MNSFEKTILIVEDDPLNQAALRITISKKYNVECCNSDNTFYKILNSKKIDLIIMDIAINGNKSGLQLIEEVRRLPKYKKIPILCLTAHIKKTDEKNALSAGANIFIPKPVIYPKLMELIKKFI